MSRRGILAIVGTSAVVVGWLTSGTGTACPPEFAGQDAPQESCPRPAEQPPPSEERTASIPPSWWRGAPELLPSSAATKPLGRRQLEEAELVYRKARWQEFVGEKRIARFFYREVQQCHEGSPYCEPAAACLRELGAEEVLKEGGDRKKKSYGKGPSGVNVYGVWNTAFLPSDEMRDDLEPEMQALWDECDWHSPIPHGPQRDAGLNLPLLTPPAPATPLDRYYRFFGSFGAGEAIIF
jgi:hypothetical protein